ncbi:hypothetical protein BASA81_005412 [Batrachochytrium salamandrivorans]|nr:hypothetical protein BASA81_005412 [Batrachochytrium salamandrivorans]
MKSLLLALSFFSVAVFGALVTVDQVFYFDLAACPTNFAPLDAGNNGLLFLGDNATFPNAGYSNGKALFMPGTDKQHAHTGSFAISAPVSTSVSSAPVGPFGSSALRTGTATMAALGFTSGSGSGFPFVQLLACKMTNSSSGLQVPAGIVTIMNPKGSTSAAIKTCGSGFVDFTQANGRFMIATSTAPPSASGYAFANPTPAFSPLYGDATTHTHTLSAQWTMNNRQACGPFPQSNIWAAPGTYTASGPSSSASLDLPYRVAKLCKAVDDLTAADAPELPNGALAFFAAASCPASNWAPADAKYNGRLIVSLPSGGINGQTFGGSTLLNPGTAGLPHSHASWTGGSVTLGTGAKVTLMTGTRCLSADPAVFSLDAGTVTADMVFIPTVTVLLCRKFTPPTRQPTGRPSLRPTTMQPSIDPTTSFPSFGPTTIAPTAAPTASPSSAPTTSPSLVPTMSPSLAPADFPSQAPTASPSLAPADFSSLAPTASPLPKCTPAAVVRMLLDRVDLLSLELKAAKDEIAELKAHGE